MASLMAVKVVMSSNPPSDEPPRKPPVEVPAPTLLSEEPAPAERGGPVAIDSQPPPGPVAFPVCGIGASAGGLEALEALVARLKPDRMAFVVVQHLAPGHVSMLGDILRRATSLKVVTVERAIQLESGTIYVAPPHLDLAVEGDGIQVEPVEGSRRPRLPIDMFFRSLARNVGSRAIGVILSGSGTDGTLGLKAIKDEGGIALVQEPSTATQSGMPQSALDAACADVAFPPAEIGDELMRLSTHPYVGKARTSKLVDRGATGTIFAQLRSAYGVDFGQYKPSTTERRIGRRMALHKIERTEDYLSFLRSDTSELRLLYNDLLIGVTSFFRDPEAFEALKTSVFPRMVEDRPADAPIRIWVAGCATGEEAYSVAIALLEFLGERANAFKIQIFATDVDEDALVRARLAAYPTNIEIDVSHDRLRRFFVRTERGYQVTRTVRDVVVFARHDIGKDPPFSRLDFVTCRNVLIYMQTALQKKILRIFHYALHPDSYLLLGVSESVGDAADLFSLVDRKLKVYVKKNIPVTAIFDFAMNGHPGPDEAHGAGPPEPRSNLNVTQLADRKVIEKYAPPGVIVDDRLEVIQFRGRTGTYLEPAPGAATLNLLKLARPELLVALRTTVHRSLTEGLPVTSAPVPMWGDHGPRAVILDVMPLPDASGRKCLLVLFNEAAPRGRPVETTGEARPKQGADSRVVELERELAMSKEYLQSTVEELEAANEELQSSNEELQSSNEELQSTNEELETSKEELQSTNEELATVNDELHNRMAQLSVANDDLQNVLLHGSSAIVIVGADLRIRRFSSAAEKLLSLIPGDVGRPIAYLRNVMSIRDLEQVAGEAISSVALREQRVRGIDGFWYHMRMMPYVTADHAIRGLVVEFTRAPAPAATSVAAEMSALARQVLSTLSQPMILVDRPLHLVWGNRAFFEAFGIGPAALERPVAEAWGSSTEPTEFWAFLEALLSGHSTRDVLMERPFGRPSGRPMRFSGKVVPSEGDRPPLAAVFMQEV